jgi:signal transduction histidine kinase
MVLVTRQNNTGAWGADRRETLVAGQPAAHFWAVSESKRVSPVAGLQSLTRRMPLELKLPLLISALFAAVLSVTLAATYTTLRASNIERAAERLTRATRQLALTGAATLTARTSTYAAVGEDSVVRRALRGERVSSAALSRVLQRAALPTDSALPVELWSTDGRRLGSFGTPRWDSLRVAAGQPEVRRTISATVPASRALADSLRVSPLYVEESGAVHLWFVMPIRANGRDVGYIAHQRRIAPAGNAQTTLRELSGDSVSLYYRNEDGSLWSSITGAPMAPVKVTDSVERTGELADGERVLVHEERLGSSPLVVGMYVPRSAVLARPARTFRSILSLSLVLLLGGLAASWAIGRSVARPLGTVTMAAGSVASGRYDARVPEEGDVEVRRLAQSFNHMAAEIARAQAALEQQTAQAKAASSAKSDFLTTMSHELRTPLNAIGGYVELLEMELRGPITAAQRRDLERIKASQQHLLGLISGVLDLARVEAGTTSYDLLPIPIDAFLADIDALIAPQAAAKSVKLEYVPCAAHVALIADREKLRQILLNLLSNAVRHTPSGGRIRLAAEPRPEQVAIAVEDTGPGIPADKRAEIFEPFVQLDRSLTKTREGLGLGLAISRDLARGMGGDLTVDGDFSGGARFVLVLPRGTTDPERPVERTGEMRAILPHA